MNVYAKSSDAYLSQRILGASPEQQAALIMEAAQLHLGKAIQALNKQDLSGTALSLYRVTEALTEATVRLNREDGGELVHRLDKLYEWWAKEILLACEERDTARMETVAMQMGEIRQAWEQFHEKTIGSRQNEFTPLENQVV